jgi:uncharacterized protein (DUF58 family)
MARPTARGIALLGIAAAAYGAARALGTWEIYLLAFTFLAAVLLSWLLVLSAARGLAADRSLVPARPVAGDPVRLVFRVRTRSRVPGLEITVEDAAAGLGAVPETVTFESLRPRRAATAATPERPARRGIHRLPAMTVTAEDPLGLCRARRTMGRPLDITVYPRLVPLHSCALLGDAGTRGLRGERGERAAGTTEFRGIRPADPGEPLSHVDWKATAKTGSLMMREMGDPAGKDLTLVLEGTAACVIGRPPRTNYELAIQALGSVADFSLQAGRTVDLLLHEERWQRVHLTPDPGGRHRLREALAAAEPTAKTSLPDALGRLARDRDATLRTECLLVALLALDADAVRALLALRAAGVPVAVVSVAPEPFAAVPADDPAAAATAGPAAAADVRTLERRAPLDALAALGVTCVRLGPGDDLHTALAECQATRPWAAAR